MLVHLGALALEAGAHPIMDILIDAWPHVSGGEQTLSGPNSRMEEKVESIKNLVAELRTCQGLVVPLLEGVGPLSVSHGLEVNGCRRGVKRIHFYAGEGVRCSIGSPLDVPDV